MKKFLKSNWFGLLAVGLSFGIMIYAICFNSDAGNFITIIKNIKVPWILAAVLCVVIYWLFDGCTLHTITHMKYKHVSILKSIKTSMVGLFYSALTPFAVGGQPMQVIDMTYSKIDVGDATSIIVIKMIIYQFCLTAFGLIGCFISSGYYANTIHFYKIMVFAGIVLNLGFIFIIMLICINQTITFSIACKLIYFLAKLRIIKEPNKTLKKVVKQIHVFHKSSLIIYKSKLVLFKSLVITVMQLTIFYSVPFCIYKSFGLSGTSIFVIISGNALISLITAFVPIPGGSGVAEGSFYLFFEPFMPSNVIIPAVFLWRFITYYSVIIVGGIVNFGSVILKTKADKKVISD